MTRSKTRQKKPVEAKGGRTEAQRIALETAYELEQRRGLAVFPRRGQHAMFDALVLRGLLTYEGPGVDDDDHMHNVQLYRLTEAGREAVRTEGGAK